MKGRKFSVMTNLNELLQKIEEVFSHYYNNSVFNNSRDNSDLVDIRLNVGTTGHVKNGS